MIRTVLADDRKLFCDGLERVLNDSGHFQVVQKFHNGQTLLEKFGAHPEVLLEARQAERLIGAETWFEFAQWLLERALGIF